MLSMFLVFALLLSVVGAKKFGGYLPQMLKEPELSERISQMLARLNVTPYPVTPTAWRLDYNETLTDAIQFTSASNETALALIGTLTADAAFENYIRFHAQNLKFHANGTYLAKIPFLGTSPTGRFEVSAKQAKAWDLVTYAVDYNTGVITSGCDGVWDVVDEFDGILTPPLETSVSNNEAKDYLVQDATNSFAPVLANEIVQTVVLARFVENEFWRLLNQSKSVWLSGIIQGSALTIPDINATDHSWRATDIIVQLSVQQGSLFNFSFINPRCGHILLEGFLLTAAGRFQRRLGAIESWNLQAGFSGSFTFEVYGNLSQPQSIFVRASAAIALDSVSLIPDDLPKQFVATVPATIYDQLPFALEVGVTETATRILTSPHFAKPIYPHRS